MKTSPKRLGFLKRPGLRVTAPLRGDPDSLGVTTLQTHARALGDFGAREDTSDNTKLALGLGPHAGSRHAAAQLARPGARLRPPGGRRKSP